MAGAVKILGLTGGIGMGKSNAAKVLRSVGVPVFDADATVHRLQGCGGAAVKPIGVAFPGSISNGAVDRGALRAAVLEDKGALKRLERIVHPLVRQAERRFLAQARRARRRLVALDIPLLFETGGADRVDHIVVVSAPPATQRARVRRRGTMSAAQIAAVIGRQMADAEKRRRADTVVRTGLSRGHTQRQLRRLVRQLRS